MMILRRLYSSLFWAFLLVSSVLLFPVAVLVWAITAPFDKRKVLLHLFTSFWASLYTWLNPAWPLTVEDRNKINTREACVIVANHLSLLDILILFRLFIHFKWVSKIENFHVPCIGWNMTLNRYIPLVRGERQSVIKMMQACHETLAAGSSLMMFPEGTRSPSGRMRDFKPGAFELAINCRVPIQPLVIQGTANALPKRGFILRGRHPITIKALDCIHPEEFGERSVAELTLYVRSLMAEHLDEKKLERVATPI
jgi:1-acyl-sn-glycerol-3-phosphate acyltransferase